MSFEWLDSLLFDAASALGLSTFELNPLIAVVLVGLTCGMVGSLVVGNRMAFFSDAMAHTAFAGVALALLSVVLLTGVRTTLEADRYMWTVPLATASIGMLVGVSIAFVRERTGLTNDTVIGVFFALSMGVGAMLLPEIRTQIRIDPDQFLFGAVTLATGADLFILFALAAVTIAVVVWRYNALTFASFNPSLARSRGVNLRGNSYLFIVLLALVVNLSIKAVGVLLINALLVVPAAAAANLGRNLRQVFWLTLVGSIGAGVLGQQISHHIRVPIGASRPLEFAPGGTIVVVAVSWFFLTMAIASLRGRRVASSGDRAG
ncbi:metal ABC transporter permease [Fimbriiglobus ruber]|uniref:Cation ABC transporter permease n=1 Tax=Fimbriiglobus ruber TaxID=1908690 RepID=A0A225ED57_9BACT|nr:metal ABC transporter permease [Fimbriiglobus ruber]OWK47249.1 cation ABC transporter permease [Fimbriiglobus ruber]